jgi:polysaccharide lyase family 4-like protein
MNALIIFGFGGFALAALALEGTAQTRGGVGLNTSRAGTVVGHAFFSGNAGQPTAIAMDAPCKRLTPGAVHDEAVEVGAGGGLRNVFVHVKDGLDPEAQFEVLGVRAGQPLAIVNGDDTLHNVHARPTVNPPFNIGQPIAGMRATRIFANPEVMVPLSSDIRPWMKAFVGVVAHPFFAVTGSDGTFEIHGVPPGQYTIDAWHETLGIATERVTVAEAQATTISFTFAAR